MPYDPNFIKGPWKTIEPATGKGWRAMWTPEADALHREIGALLRIMAPFDDLRWGLPSEVICEAADQVRAELGPEHREAVVESCFVLSIWLERFAPQDGTLRGLGVMLEQRAAARGWNR